MPVTASSEPRIKIAITGAAGRMGQMLIRAILSTESCVLSGALERSGAAVLGLDAGELLGGVRTGVMITDDLHKAFADADAVIDFTTPAATRDFSAYAAAHKIAHIVGTTGLSDEDKTALRVAAKDTVVVQSGNMSLGVNLLAALVEQVARALDTGFDIEILEMHHRHKVDAPSGTALMLGEAAAAGRKVSLQKQSVRVRNGHTGARKSGDIGFATLRGGSVVGDHSVLFAGQSERITLSHHAEDRAIFAHGALKAALWAHKKPAGFYSMRDVLGL
jgi:4-hydroxy-tetrahydrodipicolinate reductase